MGFGVYCSLGRWASQIPNGFHVSDGTWVSFPFRSSVISPTGLSPSMAGRSRPFDYDQERNESPAGDSEKTPQPPDSNACRLDTIGVWTGAGSLAATTALSYLISLPADTEMFHFSAYSPRDLCIGSRVIRYKPDGVSPFGHPRFKACLRLPGAYRSLPRPSSPSETKASTVSPW